MNCIRIYRSWPAETATLTDAEKGRLMDCLVHFLITGEERPPEGNERFVYPLMMERIRREDQTHERNKQRRAEEREARGK